MRALVLPGVGQPLRLSERPIPHPGPGEARVRIDACGVCGSDLSLQNGGFGADKLPVVPGHEAAGTIDAIGAEVDGWAVGDQVALYYIDADPHGAWSRSGRPHLDPGLRRMGVDVDGAFADYVVRPAHTLVRPPFPFDPLSLAVLTDAVATPYHALRQADLSPADTVLVLGIGGVGTNAVQLASHAGARVIAASRSPTKRALAARLGASAVIPIAGDREVDLAVLRRACGGDGPDVVLQCAGSSSVDELAIAVAAPGGRVVLVGASTEPFGIRSVDLIWRELRVMGSRGFTPNDIAAVLALYAEGAIAVDHMTANVRPLEEANAALDDLRAGRVVRTVLLPATDADGRRRQVRRFRVLQAATERMRRRSPAAWRDLPCPSRSTRRCRSLRG